MKYFVLIISYIIFAFIASIFIGKILKFGLREETPKPKEEKK